MTTTIELDVQKTESLNLTISKPLTYYKKATSDHTRRAYRSDIRAFIQWGGALPTTTRQVLTYLESEAVTLNPRTLARRLTALKQWHHYQGLPDPTHDPLIHKTLSGIKRVHGKPKTQAVAITLTMLTQWIGHLNQNATFANLRNQALILVGFFGALRGSELVAIRCEDITWQEDGIRIQIPVSKTDPHHEGQSVAIPYGKGLLCAVRALKAWLQESGIESGFVFRGIAKNDSLKQEALRANSLNPLLKQLAQEAGIIEANQISSHSLRRGLATEASRKGASMKSIMTQGRWCDTRTVLSYIEAGQAFEDNVVRSLFGAS